MAGARPNFMKIAPLLRALDKYSEKFDYRLIHTGQHYDQKMSGIFFEELDIPQPDYLLNCGGGSHAEQTAKIMVEFERVCLSAMPDCVVVVGDVNSTAACTIAAKKIGIRVAHIEAGLRSGDMTMPEEINRIVTDSISDWFFCTEPDAVRNLLKEGKSKEAIYDVGNIMIDNLYYQNKKLESIDKSCFESERIKKKLSSYGVVTLHRPSNVDNPLVLNEILCAFEELSRRIPLVFPAHPRTMEKIENLGINLGSKVIVTNAMSYMDFLNLWKDAEFILTDSGGLQDESTGLGVPCLTLRDNTERPITCLHGTNKLIGTNAKTIIAEASKASENSLVSASRPPLWDGKTSERILDIMNQNLMI